MRALLPPVPSPQSARVVQQGCDAAGMPGMDGHDDPTDFVERVSADGLAERVFSGVNPRVEVSSVPFDSKPTAQQREQASQFVDQVRSVVKARGWDDPANVVRDGYRPMQQCNSHLINIAAVLDGRDLDPEHPEFIVVEPGPDGKTHFHSVMFMASTNTGHGPQRFGPLAIWHFHSGSQCMIDGVILVPQTSATCPAGTARFERTPEMLHVSLTGNPFDPGM